MANFMIMLYTNQTFEEVSSHLDNKDFTAHIYNKLTDLYQAGAYLNEILILIINTEHTIKYDCQEFYKYLDNSLFSKILDKYEKLNDTERLYLTLESFCESSNILSFKNYKTSYMQLFNPIEGLMQRFGNGEYEEIIKFINDNDISGLQIYFFIIYIYLLDLMNNNIKEVYRLLIVEINSKIDIMGIIFLVAFIHLVASVFFIFRRNLDKDCQNFIQMRKIFKICNINE